MSVRLVSKYRDRSSRTSSASRFSDSVVNPTRSANSTDTSRRSEVGASVTSAASAPSGAPHWPQNRSSGSLAAPHEGQATARGLPHREQNRRPGRFSVPQLGQVTEEFKFPRGQ